MAHRENEVGVRVTPFDVHFVREPGMPVIRARTPSSETDNLEIFADGAIHVDGEPLGLGGNFEPVAVVYGPASIPGDNNEEVVELAEIVIPQLEVGDRIVTTITGFAELTGSEEAALFVGNLDDYTLAVLNITNDNSDTNHKATSETYIVGEGTEPGTFDVISRSTIYIDDEPVSFTQSMGVPLPATIPNPIPVGGINAAEASARELTLVLVTVDIVRAGGIIPVAAVLPEPE